MANKFEEGDVVKLNSGGPDMSVHRVPDDDSDDDDSYQCKWFAGKKLEDGWFNGAELEVVKKKK